MGNSLAEILDAAAHGRFPADDGGVTVVAQPGRRDAGVVAFTAHSVVFTDEDPAWVHATLATVGGDPLAATMNARFLTALLDRTGRTTDTIDLLTVAPALPGPPPLRLREIDDPGHPRVRRARVHRDDVRVWAGRRRHPGHRPGCGRPLGDRDRGRSGRARPRPGPQPRPGRPAPHPGRHVRLVPAGHRQRAQHRVFQAAGYRPIGAE